MSLTCVECGAQFERYSHMGPVPKFCSGRCRQRAHLRRVKPHRTEVEERIEDVLQAVEFCINRAQGDVPYEIREAFAYYERARRHSSSSDC